jgi:hypothetical protein
MDERVEQLTPTLESAGVLQTGSQQRATFRLIQIQVGAQADQRTQEITRVRPSLVAVATNLLIGALLGVPANQPLVAVAAALR